MISIITPTYNTGQYLTRYITSILEQDYTDWELIIVDDCSTDGTYESLQAYAKVDSRVKLYRNTSNIGCGLTRRRCIDLAQGDYFAFVDSDDYVDSDFLSTMLAAIERTQSEVAICGTYNHRGDYQYISQDLVDVEYTFHGSRSYPEYMSTRWILQYNGNKLFSRRVIETITYSDRRFCEDSSTTYLWLHNADKIVVIPKSLYHYIKHEGSNSHKTPENMLRKTVDTVECLFEHYQFCTQHGYTAIRDRQIYGFLKSSLTQGIMLADIDSDEYKRLDKVRKQIIK